MAEQYMTVPAVYLTGFVEGEGATLVALKAYELAQPAPAQLGLAFAVANPGPTALEMVAHQVVLRAADGTETSGAETSLVTHYKGGVPQGDVLLPGDVRPGQAYVALPPTVAWQEAMLKVTVRPLTAQGRALYWRSRNIIVATASYVDATTYQLQGQVLDLADFAAKFRQEKRGALKIRVVALLYDSAQDLVAGLSTYVTSATGHFAMRLAVPPSLGKIASIGGLFAELTP